MNYFRGLVSSCPSLRDGKISHPVRLAKRAGPAVPSSLAERARPLNWCHILM
uniref:Uncharacterized protein n=1 Tax=Brassica oleracea var. oleracea TaxID=109376 RepID=A0A0D3DMV5_BRAOL